MMSFHLNNSRFSDYVDHIYATEFEIKHTTDTARSASFVDDLHLEIELEPIENSNVRQKRCL